MAKIDDDQIRMFDPPEGGGIPEHEALRTTSMPRPALLVLEQLNRAYTIETRSGADAGASKKYDRDRLRMAMGALVTAAEFYAALAYLVPLGLASVTYVGNDGTMDGKPRYQITTAGKAEVKRVRSILGAEISGYPGAAS